MSFRALDGIFISTNVVLFFVTSELLARLKLAVATVTEKKYQENLDESQEVHPLRSLDSLSRRSRTSSVSSVDTTMSGSQEKVLRQDLFLYT